MSRLIDADALLKALGEYDGKFAITSDYKGTALRKAHIKDFAMLINDQPVIDDVVETWQLENCQEKNGKYLEMLKGMWTPCNEKLPEEEVNVLLYLKCGEMIIGHLFEWGDDEFCFYEQHEDDRYDLEEVEAWQPLPEEY